MRGPVGGAPAAQWCRRCVICGVSRRRVISRAQVSRSGATLRLLCRRMYAGRGPWNERLLEGNRAGDDWPDRRDDDEASPREESVCVFEDEGLKRRREGPAVLSHQSWYGRLLALCGSHEVETMCASTSMGSRPRKTTIRRAPCFLRTSVRSSSSSGISNTSGESKFEEVGGVVRLVVGIKCGRFHRMIG